jgi:uncharacterized membrane protein YphA (DoxX/SURF4 family)
MNKSLLLLFFRKEDLTSFSNGPRNQRPPATNEPAARWAQLSQNEVVAMTRANPFADVVAFLIGSAHDYNPFGAVRYVSVIFYLAVIAGSFVVAWRNWRDDPAQRTGRNVAIWVMRLVLAGMWYQGTIWKLPLPVSDAFMYWTGALAKFSSFSAHAALVKAVFLPGIAVLQPLVYLLEISFTLAFSLGLFVRFFGVVAVLFTAHLWIGLYNDPTEWAWTYIAIMVAHGMFAANQAGRSLGLDAWLLRAPPVFARGALVQRVIGLAT